MKAQQLREIVKILGAPCADRRKTVSLMRAIREFKGRDAVAGASDDAVVVERAIAMAKAMNADASFVKLLKGLMPARATKARVEVTFNRPTIPFHQTTGCVTVWDDTSERLLFESMFGVYFKAPTLFNAVQKVSVVLPPNDLSEARRNALMQKIESKFIGYWNSFRSAA